MRNMARTKGSKNGVRKLSQPTNKRISPFVYNVGQSVQYKGILFDEYINKIGVVRRRSVEKGCYKYYFVEFEDGKILGFKEEWISEYND
jgi:hypothetical protein